MPKKTGASGFQPIQFAVIGLGHIAQTAVLPAFQHAKKYARLAALVSGDAEKLEKIGRKYKVKNLCCYEKFEECLAKGEVDAVYIALPNSLHAEYAVRALELGVHVLCEKPLAMNEEECRRMIDASEKSGAKLMTAYRLHFDRANLEAVKLAQEKIGELRYFSSDFSYQMRDRDNIRLRADEGGTPLWDIGIYCINAARYLFRDEPIEVSGMRVHGIDSRFREADEMASVTMRFPGERLATFTCSFGAGQMASYRVVGTKGSVALEAAYEYQAPRDLTLQLGERKKRRRFQKTDQFAAELVYFADCVRRGRKPEPSGYEGWADVRIILAIEKAMRTGKAVPLSRAPRSLENKTRPAMRQWVQRPPVAREPEPVNVDSPSGD